MNAERRAAAIEAGARALAGRHHTVWDDLLDGLLFRKFSEGLYENRINRHVVRKDRP